MCQLLRIVYKFEGFRMSRGLSWFEDVLFRSFRSFLLVGREECRCRMRVEFVLGLGQFFFWRVFLFGGVVCFFLFSSLGKIRGFFRERRGREIVLKILQGKFYFQFQLQISVRSVIVLMYFLFCYENVAFFKRWFGRIREFQSFGVRRIFKISKDSFFILLEG